MEQGRVRSRPGARVEVIEIAGVLVTATGVESGLGCQRIITGRHQRHRDRHTWSVPRPITLKFHCNIVTSKSPPWHPERCTEIYRRYPSTSIAVHCRTLY